MSRAAHTPTAVAANSILFALVLRRQQYFTVILQPKNNPYAGRCARERGIYFVTYPLTADIDRCIGGYVIVRVVAGCKPRKGNAPATTARSPDTTSTSSAQEKMTNGRRSGVHHSSVRVPFTSRTWPRTAKC